LVQWTLTKSRAGTIEQPFKNPFSLRPCGGHKRSLDKLSVEETVKHDMAQLADQGWTVVFQVNINQLIQKGYYESPYVALEISVPIVTQASSESIQQLARTDKVVSWEPGSFDESFSDLNSLSKGIDSLKMTQLVGHLAELRAAGYESVEILGVKLPKDFLATWGLLILLGLQIYFYAHIRQFHQTFGSERMAPFFPWIACYRSILSRIMYISSVTILPVVTALYLPFVRLTGTQHFSYATLIKGGSFRQTLFLFAVILASLTVSCLTLWEVNENREIA
jgi:hypothetical protein